MANNNRTMTFRTDERNDIHKMIEKYRCSPFTGRCHTEEITFYKDRKTGLYHLIFPESVLDRFKIKEDFVINNSSISKTMIMIQPTDEDNDFLIFKKKK